MVALLIMAALTISPSEPIAHAGTKTIRYADIRMSPESLPPSVRNSGNVDEALHELEQQELNRLVGKELMTIAAREYGIEIDREAALPEKYRDGRIARQMVETDRLIAEAALRVLRGEDKELVYEQELSEEALRRKQLDQVYIPRRFFDHALQMFNSEDVITRRLQNLSEAKKVALLDEHFVEKALGAKLDELVARFAAGWGVPYEEARERFWCDIVTRANARVVHARFTFPSLRGRP